MQIIVAVAVVVVDGLWEISRMLEISFIFSLSLFLSLSLSLSQDENEIFTVGLK